MRRILAGIVALLAPGISQAEMVTFHYNGTLKTASSSDAALGSLAWGTPVAGTITYDTAAPSLPLPPWEPFNAITPQAIYHSAGSYTLTVGGVTLAAGGADAGLDVTLDGAGGGFGLPIPLPVMQFLTFESAQVQAPAVTGGAALKPGVYTYFSLLDYVEPGSPDGNPRVLPADLSAWRYDEGTVLFQFNWDDPSAPDRFGYLFLEASVTDLEAAPLGVPEPGALLLAAVGAGLTLARRGLRFAGRRRGPSQA